MIRRRKLPALREALDRQAAVALIGPRQVGKTTLAHELAQAGPFLYLDLEAAEDRRKLADPALFLRQYEDRLVILDEIHRVPDLFTTLRGLIDEGRRRGRRFGRFLLLGSASMDLLRQSSESLAGRIAHVELGPFDVLELDDSPASLARVWTRGGFPDSYLTDDDRRSFAWRKDFIRTYLEREIPLLGPRIAAEALENLWTMLAHNQGGLLNASRLAGALMVSAQTVTRYIDLLVDLLLVRHLRPYHTNIRKRLVKSSKVYIRDSGLLHALLGISSYDALAGHPVVGASWEGLAIETLLAVAPEFSTPSFYRSAGGAEIDLLLTLPGQGIWAVDIKRGLTTRPGRGFHDACLDVKPARAFALNGGTDRYRIAGDVEVIGLRALAAEVAAA